MNDAMIFVMAAFFKKVGGDEPSSCSWDIEGLKGNPLQAVLAAITEESANADDPVRSANAESCGGSDYSEFQLVHGKRRGVLLLHMAFNNKSHARHFRAPSGAHVADWIRGSDEEGFLHAKG